MLLGSGTGVSVANVCRFCRSWVGGGMVLVLLCLTVYVPGLVGIAPVDRDESRFAQASRQMFESGDVVVPRVQDRARLNKPPLIYWLQCGAIGVFGDRHGQYPNANIWVFRVPSVVCAMIAVVLTWRLGLSMFDARAALLGAALLAVCPMVVWDAHQARADQLLLACTTGTMFALWCAWKGGVNDQRRDRALAIRGQRGAWFVPVVFWVMMGLGILAKGPMTPLVAGLTVVAASVVSRRWRWAMRLRPVMGLLIVFAIVGPWVWAVGERVGWHTYLSTVIDETIGRSGGAKEGHWGPPGYHLVALVVLFWPGVLMTATAFVRAAGRVWPSTHLWRRHGDSVGNDQEQPARVRLGFVGLARAIAGRTESTRAEVFLLCWIVPAWVVFELIATKLPHYTLPMYPAIALLSARAVLGGVKTVQARALLPGEKLWLVVGMLMSGMVVAVAMVVLISPVAGSHFSRVYAGLGLFVSALVLIGLARCVGWLRDGAVVRVQRVSVLIAAMTVVAWMTSGPPRTGLVPGGATPLAIDSLTTIRRDFMNHPIATVFHEDSVIFWTRGQANRIGESDVDAWFSKNPDGAAIVPLASGFAAWTERGYTTGHLFLLGGKKYTTIRRDEPAP